MLPEDKNIPIPEDTLILWICLTCKEAWHPEPADPGCPHCSKSLVRYLEIRSGGRTLFLPYAKWCVVMKRLSR